MPSKHTGREMRQAPPTSFWLRAGIALLALAFPAAMALMIGCNSVTFVPEPSFYISHAADGHAIWYRAAPADPAPLTIAALPAGTAVNQVAALSFSSTTDWLYVLTPSSFIVLDQVGTAFQTVATIALPAGSLAFDIDANANFAYVSTGNSVTVLDLNTYAVAGTITLQAGSAPQGVAVVPDGSKVYVANSGGNSVSVIAASPLALSGTITVGNHPNRLAIAPSGHEVYVANSADGSVSVIDEATDTVSATITGLPNTLAVAVSGTGATLWAGQAPSPTGPGSVIPYATSTLTAAAANATGGNPSFLAPSGDYSYVASMLNSNQAAEYLHASSSNTAKTWTVGASPTSVSVVRAINRNPSLPAQTQCTLTVTTVGSGTVAASPLPTGGSYPCGTSVTLTATPGAGKSFFGWSGALTGNASPTSITLSSNKTVVATFGTAYEVDSYGCSVSITSASTAVTTSPLTYPANSTITISSTLPAVEVLQNGVWTTLTSFPASVTLFGPISVFGPCSLPKTSACVAPPASMTGWWGFEPVSGGAGGPSNTIPDLSGNHNDGTLAAGALQSGGKVQSYLPSGTAFATVPSSAGLNFGTGSFSGDMWVRWSDPAANTTDSYLLDKVGSTTNGFQLGLTRSSETPGLARLMLRIYDGSVFSSVAEWDSAQPAIPPRPCRP